MMAGGLILGTALGLVSAGSAAAEQEVSFMTRFARQPVCDALAEWSLLSGQSYAHAAYLPDLPVVVAEPGQEVSLPKVLAAAGWTLVRTRDAVLIVRQGDAEKVAGLAKTLRESQDEFARRAAAHALGLLTVPEAIPPLVDGLSDPSLSVQFHCLEALWAIEKEFETQRLPSRVSLFRLAAFKPDALVALAKRAESDKPRRAWRYGVTLLGRAGMDAVRPLALAALNAADPRVRLIASSALRETAKSEDARPLLESAVFATWGAILNEGRVADTFNDWAVQRETAGVRARLDPRSVAVAATGKDEQSACLACEALGGVDVPEGLAPLIEVLTRGSATVVPFAAEALGRSRQAGAEEALVAALRAAAPWRQAAAARGLAVLNRPRSKAVLETLVAAAKGAPEVRAAVAAALPLCGGEGARQALLELSRDGDAHVRLATVRALVRMGGAAALARLNELADDSSSSSVKSEALRGLGWLGGMKEAERLAAIAKDKSLGREGADAAIIGLSQLLPADARDLAIKTLAELLDDPMTCPYAVGRAATHLADSRLVPGLLKVQKNIKAGNSLRVDCMDALGRIGTKETTEALARNWWEYENMARYQGGRALRDNVDKPAVLETLIALTKSSGDRLTAASFSLQNSRDPRAVDALVALVKSRGEGVTGAATCLGLMADPAATHALLAAANDPTDPGRFVSGRALRVRDLAWQAHVKEALVTLYGWQPDGAPPPLADQKPNTWVLRQYSRDFDDMSHAPTLSYESGATYDSLRDRVVQWGAHGRRYDAPQTGETWVYDPVRNVWTEMGRLEDPPGTCCTREIVYDPVNDVVITKGGGGGGHGWLATREQALRTCNPWVYHPSTDRWVGMKPLGAPGFTSFPAFGFDPRHGVLVGLATRPQPGGIWTYNAYTNQWLPEPAQQSTPPPSGYGHCVAYDTLRGRTYFGGGGMLWAYDLTTGRWTDLKPKGMPERFSPMLYDTVNDALLAFNPSPRGTPVYAYDPAANAWTALRTDGMQPDYREWDAAFDTRQNVAVVCGGEITSSPGSPNVRETWTYRFAAADANRPLPLAPPSQARVVVRDGKARITWTASPDKRATGYVVSRVRGERTWGFTPEALNPGKPGTGTEFVDSSEVPAGEVTIYLVQSVDAAGAVSPEPAIARTQPPAPLGVVATWNADQLARIAWEKSPAEDVVGYHVYRAPVTPGGLYGNNPVRDLGNFTRITAAPVQGTACVDPEKAQPGELSWALAPRAYAVRAVNALGVESGLSPWVVTLPATVQGIVARRREDGSVVVRWEKDPNPDVLGYVVYRMDNWRADQVTRVNEVAVPGTSLIDPNGRPTGERQRYWVVAVDRFGQEGPSGTGAWTFNRS